MQSLPDNCRNIVRSAARNLVERDLIGAIVDSPLSPLPRRVYYQWLESNGDALARPAEYLTEIAEKVCESGDGEPPDLGYPFYRRGYSQSWKNMLGEPLFHTVVRDQHTWQIRNLVFKYANPRLGIVAEDVGIDRMLIQDSRFGGRASLANDVEWPTCKNGELNFIAQIALNEIQNTQVARFLPNGGWLSFFALNENVGGNCDDGDSRVIYTPPSATLEWRDPPHATEFRNSSVCRLVFSETWDLPEDDHVVAESDRKTLKQTWREHDLDFDGLRRSFGEFDGHILGDLRHYRTDFVARSSTDRNLACFNSIDSLGWNWCDGEHLSIFIEQDDLIRCDFSNASGYAS